MMDGSMMIICIISMVLIRRTLIIRMKVACIAGSMRSFVWVPVTHTVCFVLTTKLMKVKNI